MKPNESDAKESTCFETLATTPDESSRCFNDSCPFAFSKACRGCALVSLVLNEKENMTLQEIGDLYGISRMRVCQIEKKIVAKLTDSHT